MIPCWLCQRDITERASGAAAHKNDVTNRLYFCYPSCVPDRHGINEYEVVGIITNPKWVIGLTSDCDRGKMKLDKDSVLLNKGMSVLEPEYKEIIQIISDHFERMEKSPRIIPAPEEIE